MKQLFTLLSISILSTSLLAQKNTFKGKEFKELKRNELIIEMIGDDEYEVYKNDYNTFIKDLMNSYWVFNGNVSFKSKSEVDKIKKGEETNKLICWISVSEDVNQNMSLNWHISKSGVKGSKSVYSIALSKKKFNKDNYETDEFFAQLFGVVTVVNSHFMYMAETGKVSSITEMNSVINVRNCKQASEFRAFIPKYKVDKQTTPSKMKQAFDVKLLDYHLNSSDLAKYIRSKEEEKGVLISIPLNVNSVNPTELDYIKVFISIKSGKLLIGSEWGAGESKGEKIKYTDIKPLGKC